MKTSLVCPNCWSKYLIWDEEVGQMYCTECDMFYSDEDLKNIREEREAKEQAERLFPHIIDK